jgi:hypothetical protein
MLSFYPDKADLSEILSPRTPAGEAIRRAVDAGVVRLCLSPVHIWELSNSPEKHATRELAELRSLAGEALGLPSPGNVVASVVREVAGLADHELRFAHGRADGVVDTVLSWTEDQDAWNNIALADRVLRNAYQAHGAPEDMPMNSLADDLRAIPSALKTPDRGEIDEWEANTLNLWLGGPDAPESVHDLRAEYVDRSRAIFDGYRRSRFKRVRRAIGNLVWGRLAGPLVMSRHEMAVYLLAPHELSKAAFQSRTAPNRLIRRAVAAPSPLRVVFETAVQRGHDKKRKVRFGDFADLAHLMYAPLVDVMTCDKTHRGALLDAARRSESQWVLQAAERVRRTGGRGLREVLSKLPESA